MIDSSEFVPLKASSGLHDMLFFAWLFGSYAMHPSAISNDLLLLLVIQ